MIRLEQIDHLALRCASPEATKEWYVSTLGFEHVFPGQWGGSPIVLGGRRSMRLREGSLRKSGHNHWRPCRRSGQQEYRHEGHRAQHQHAVSKIGSIPAIGNMIGAALRLRRKVIVCSRTLDPRFGLAQPLRLAAISFDGRGGRPES